MSPFVVHWYSNLSNSSDQDQAGQIIMDPNWLTLGWYMYVFLKDLKRIKKHAKFRKHTKSRPPYKSAYQKIIFLICQPKHMLWVLKRTFLLSTQNIC